MEHRGLKLMTYPQLYIVTEVIGASSSAGISFGGVDAATPGASKKANEWNGSSSWTAITDMGTIRERWFKELTQELQLQR
jgi:hypothetical protein